MSAGQAKPGTDREPTGFLGFRIGFELQFFEANQILDHQSYIVDRVNLNINRAQFS